MNCRVGIQLGRCFGACFWKNTSPSMPCGYRFIVNGRSRRCGRIVGAAFRSSEEVALRDPVVREEDAVGAGQLHLSDGHVGRMPDQRASNSAKRLSARSVHSGSTTASRSSSRTRMTAISSVTYADRPLITSRHRSSVPAAAMRERGTRSSGASRESRVAVGVRDRRARARGRAAARRRRRPSGTASASRRRRGGRRRGGRARARASP